jgi:hypothetical protein
LCGSSSTTSPTPRVRVPRHSARLIVDYFASRKLVVIHFAYDVRFGVSAPLAARRRPRAISLLNFSSIGCTGTRHAPDHSVSRLDYSVPGRRDFDLRPHWLYFSHVVCRDYFSRGNTGSTSSTPRAAATPFSGRIASTTHLD